MVDTNKLLKRKDNSQLFSEIDKANKPKLDIGRVCSRRSKAKGDLDKWRSLLQTAYHYATPNFNPFENMGRGGGIAPGQEYNASIYDLTLPIAHKRLADKMLMGMVPQGQQWVKFKPGDEFGEPDSREYLQALDATQRMTDEFFKVLNRSNFYLAVSESLSDVLISTGVLAVNEGNRQQPLKFEAVPASHVMFEGNAEGGIDAVFRDWYDVRVENIKNMWPDANVEAINKDKDEKINIWEAAWVDHDASEDKRYKYAVLTDSKDLLLEQESPSWPWVVYRMRKMVGEVRGRGPSMDAYPTAATINKALEDELIAAAFTANPMYMAASDSMFNTDTFEPRPGSVVPVQMTMGQWPIQQFPGGGNIQFSSLLINDFRQQINDMLFAFPLGSVSAPDRTATEAQIRYTENLESFSAMVPRLQNEFFSPTIRRSLWVINKILPETFEGIEESMLRRILSVDGQIMGMTFDTPLMTAQGRIKTDNLLGYYQAYASIFGQEAATATLNPVSSATSLAENQGVDMKNIKTKDELEQLEQMAGQAAAQQMQQEGVVPDE